MKNSWWINLSFLVLLTSCSPVKPVGLHRVMDDKLPVEHRIGSDSSGHPNTADPFRNFTKGLFKASMTIRDHRLTGMMLIKRMDSVSPLSIAAAEAGYSYRIVFASEIGMTFFDLELTPDGMKVISCFESLNRKNLLKILESDFRVMLGLNPKPDGAVERFRQEPGNSLVELRKNGTGKVWKIYNPSVDTLTGVHGKSNPANGVMVSFTKFTRSFPGEVIIRNPLIKLQMKLLLISH